MKSNNGLTIILLMVVLILGCDLFAQDGSKEISAIKTIVIDPGHGGKDPGCHGAHAQEKVVCLSMALKLGDMIKKKYPNIKVIYTRTTDVFVELSDRAKIANQNNADLFICIHANAASPSAVGTETYVLGLHKSEAQQKIAERENAAIFLEDDKGEKYKDFDLSPDAIIARQIQLSVFLDQSISFATKLQREFTKIGRYDRGVKQAGFLVLYKTTMPSVLIETGFLTNPAEEKFLATESSQNLMASSMFTAFENYKNELEGIVTTPNAKTSESKVVNKPSEKIVNEPILNSSSIIEFRVQIETSESPVSLIDSRFKNVPVREYRQDAFYKYTAGAFENDFISANAYKNELRKMGFQHAFVVAFVDGERVNIEKAIKLAEK